MHQPVKQRRLRLHRDDAAPRPHQGGDEQRIDADIGADIDEHHVLAHMLCEQRPLLSVEELRREQDTALAHVGEGVKAHRRAEDRDVERMVQESKAEPAQQQCQPSARPALRQPPRRRDDHAPEPAGPKRSEAAIAGTGITGECWHGRNPGPLFAWLAFFEHER